MDRKSAPARDLNTVSSSRHKLICQSVSRSRPVNTTFLPLPSFPSLSLRTLPLKQEKVYILGQRAVYINYQHLPFVKQRDT